MRRKSIIKYYSHCEKRPNTEVFEYGKRRTRKNSVFEHFSHDECLTKKISGFKSIKLNCQETIQVT